MRGLCTCAPAALELQRRLVWGARDRNRAACLRDRPPRRRGSCWGCAYGGDVGLVPGASEKIEKLRILPTVLKGLHREVPIEENRIGGQNSQKLNSPPRAARAPPPLTVPRRLNQAARRPHGRVLRSLGAASYSIQHTCLWRWGGEMGRAGVRSLWVDGTCPRGPESAGGLHARLHVMVLCGSWGTSPALLRKLRN